MQQLNLTLDVVTDAHLDDFEAPSYQPLIRTVQGFLLGDFQEMYLFGERGTGKSHLLSAIYNAYQRDHSAMYLSMGEVLETDPQAFVGLETFEGLFLDDCDLIRGKRVWQEALFHLINRCRAQGTRLVITASRPVRELELSLIDLETRLGQMLMLSLPNGQDLMDRQAVIHVICRLHGWQFPPVVIEHLLYGGPHRTGDIKNVLTNISSYFTNLPKASANKKIIEEVKRIIHDQSLLSELADLEVSE